MRRSGPFFDDLGDALCIADGEEEDVEFPVIQEHPCIGDYDWLRDTIRRLCERSGSLGEYASICEEMETRKIVPSSESPPSSPPLRFGSPFSQVYATIGTIGQGGYGRVFKIKNLIDMQIYALKVVEIDKRGVAAAVREIQCLAHLNSPSLLRYYSAWIEEKPGSEFYSLNIQTEYLQGALLADLLNSSTTELDTDTIHRILFELVTAISELHEAGIVHRDLRPENIMFRENGALVVIDFGIASVSNSGFSSTISAKRPIPKVPNRVGSLTIADIDRFCVREATRESETIRNVGTPFYSSPRQLNGEKSTPADDIYSIGVIMFELLSRFKTVMEKCKSVKDLRAKFRVPERFRAAYPTETELILRMTNQRGRERPTAAAILQTSLFQGYAQAEP